MGGVADDPAHVVALVDAPRLLGRVVDHRDVGTLACQMAGDGRADLAGTADDDPHQARRLRDLAKVSNATASTMITPMITCCT